MDTAESLSLLEDVKRGHSTLGDAFDYLAAQSGDTMHAIRVAYYRSRGAGTRHHASHKITIDQESTLVSVAQVSSVNNVALSLAQSRQLALRKVGERVSPYWVARFVSRNKKEHRKRACEVLADKRAGPEVVRDAVDLFTELEHFLERYHLPRICSVQIRWDADGAARGQHDPESCGDGR